MERIPIKCAPSCDHTLTVESFSNHWEVCGFADELVLSHVEKILPSYEKAKACMSRQGVHTLYRHLKTYRWISATDIPKNHSAYRCFHGYPRSHDNRPLFYYPHFFVIQALFPESGAMKPMYRALEDHWGVRLDYTRPFYPRLDDDNAEEERKLIRGQPSNRYSPIKVYIPSKLLELSESRPSYYPDLSTGQNFIDTSESGQEPSDTLTTTDDQVADRSSNNNEDTKRDLDEAREKAKEIHDRAAQAQKFTDQAREYAAKAQQFAIRAHKHASASTEMAKSLMESLDSSKKRSARVSSDGAERSSKRPRKS
ncbi:hypothetical protein FSPOR_9368 [Fusarium sporotrichioides]|uniref:Uncharacterized protein n=1 Tax=Fusarium sporotrichioides TaxID=5514 RepID=A0A395RQI7_FUSSP|nr:hypothetical protein FSPOR_9368 [Fusarium sporotrichioides]